MKGPSLNKYHQISAYVFTVTIFLFIFFLELRLSEGRCSTANRFHPDQCPVVRLCLVCGTLLQYFTRFFTVQCLFPQQETKLKCWIGNHTRVCVCRHWPETYLCWCHGCIPQLQSGSVTVCRRCCAGFCCWVPAKGKQIIHQPHHITDLQKIYLESIFYF